MYYFLMFFPILVKWLTCPKVPQPSPRWRGRGPWPAPWTPATSPPGWPSRPPASYPRRPPSLRRRGSGQTQQVLKGTVQSSVRCVLFIWSCLWEDNFWSNFFWFWKKNFRNRLSLASYLYTAKNYWRILLIRLCSLSVFSVHTKIDEFFVHA